VVFVQFGSFAEAVARFARGGPETFYAQRYSVEFVQGLAAAKTDLTEGTDVVVLNVLQDEEEVRLGDHLRALGVELFPAGRRPRWLALLRALARLRPERLVLATPLSVVLAWALATGVEVLPLFADSFRSDGLKGKLKARLLGRLLSSKKVAFVGNHNLAASLELVRLGVVPEKVLPWDWPALISASERPPKTRPAGPPWRVLYVGQVSEAKGVGDLIDAVAALRRNREGGDWKLRIAGGHNAALVEKAARHGLETTVEFLGRIPHAEVVPLMSAHDVVVVPSRHAYPEGLPVCLFEAFCSRTPLVTSDHPMFRLKVTHDVNALVAPAGNPLALARALQRLVTEPELYERLSLAGEAAAAAFFCPLKLPELVSRWIRDSEDDRRVLASYSLASGRYDLAAERLARAA